MPPCFGAGIQPFGVSADVFCQLFGGWGADAQCGRMLVACSSLGSFPVTRFTRMPPTLAVDWLTPALYRPLQDSSFSTFSVRLFL